MESLADKVTRIQLMAKRMRRNAITMAFNAGSRGAHLGPGLSIIDITAVMYGAVLKHDPGNPRWVERDRFLLSKGHGVLGYYPALREAGYVTDEELAAFEMDEGILLGHPVMNLDKGIESSSGSLGMGLPLGAGIALAGKMSRASYLVYVLMGDGECAEGSIWEAALFAAHYKLGNLVVIVDENGLQQNGPTCEVMGLGDLCAKWSSFGWQCANVDGHDIPALLDVFTNADRVPDKPRVVIARTVKGKGCSFAENKTEWHHARLTKQQYESAFLEQDDGRPVAP